MRGAAVLVITSLRMSARLVRCSVPCSVVASVSLRSRGYFFDGKRLFTCVFKWRLCSVTVLFITVSFNFAPRLPMPKRRPDGFLMTVGWFFSSTCDYSKPCAMYIFSFDHATCYAILLPHFLPEPLRVLCGACSYTQLCVSAAAHTQAA